MSVSLPCLLNVPSLAPVFVERVKNGFENGVYFVFVSVSDGLAASTPLFSGCCGAVVSVPVPPDYDAPGPGAYSVTAPPSDVTELRESLRMARSLLRTPASYKDVSMKRLGRPVLRFDSCCSRGFVLCAAWLLFLLWCVRAFARAGLRTPT